MIDAISRRIALLVLGPAVVVCVVIAAAGWSVWPLGVLVWLLSCAILAPRTGYSLALVGSLVTLLAAETLVLRFLPLTRLDLAVSSDLLWGLCAAVLAALLVVRAPRLERPSAESLRIGAAATAAPAVGGAIVLIAAIASSSKIVSWSMNNDAAWTTMSAQHILHDGGIDTKIHHNESPLMSALMAVGASPGRGRLAGGAILESDVIRSGQLWVLVILATSLVVGLLVARSVGPGRPVLRVAAAFIAGCIPFSWYSNGYAIFFGFYSASLAMLLLVCLWALWRAAQRHPFWSLGFLLLLSTDVLATWALLVPIPLSMCLVILVRAAPRLLHRASRLRLACLVVCTAQLAAYGLLVSLPDFRAQSSALSRSGAIQTLPPYFYIGLAVLAVFVTFASRRLSGNGTSFVGSELVIVGGGVGIAVLLYTNGNQGWTYYPTKLAWLVGVLLVILIVEALAQLPSIAGKRVRTVAICTVVVAVGLCGLAYKAPVVPISPPAFSPLIAALSPAESSDSAAAVLFQFSRPGEKVMLSRYDSTEVDDFANFWLLQATAQLGTEKIRNYAYYLQPESAKSVCDAITAWHGGVMVETTVPGWPARLHAQCPNESFVVKLGK